MLKLGECSKVLVQGSLLLGIVMLAPALGRADDFAWSGDGSCSDPPFSSDIFTLGPTHTGGGFCGAFGNHTGHTITTIKFTAPYQATNPDFFCSAAPYFASCDFNVDGTIFHTGDAPPPTGSMVTLEFFSSRDLPGILVDPSTDPNDATQFHINLDTRVCTGALTSSVTCYSPSPDDPNGNCPTGICAGGWGGGVNLQVVANNADAVPEPRTGALVLIALGVLAAQFRRRKTASANLLSELPRSAACRIPD